MSVPTLVRMFAQEAKNTTRLMGLRNEGELRNVLMTIVVPTTERIEVTLSAAVMAASWLSERDIFKNEHEE